VLLYRRDLRDVGVSLLFCVALIIAGLWSITRSRASTAGIGILFLPAGGAIAGLLALLFVCGRRSPVEHRRVAAWVGLVAAVGLVVLLVRSGFNTIALNESRDAQQARYSAAIARNREQIDAQLQSNPAHQRAWLDSAIRSRLNDRAFLLAALPHDSISPEVIDTVAYNPDLGVTLEALRNRNASAQTLVRVYRTASYPDYFYQALAAHHNTPDSVLRKLHRNPGVISGLDIWLAGNPSTPRDVLVDIGRQTTDRNVVAALLENPSADCATMSALAENLMKKQNRDADDVNVQRFSQVYPTVCKRATE
jgi:hypothetical protein